MRAYSHVLGVYLGDGYVVRAGRTYRLRLYEDERYPVTAAGWAADLQVLLPSNRVSLYAEGAHRGCRVVSVYSNRLPVLFPQHGAGPKHTRDVALTEDQKRLVLPDQLLKGLMHSDGSRYVEYRRYGERMYTYTQYAFTNVSPDVLAIAAWAAGRLGLRPTASRERALFFRRRCDVEVLERVVGPKR